MTATDSAVELPSGQPTTTPGRSKYGFVLAAVGVATLLAAASAPSPFYPLFQQSLGIGSVVITVVFAVYAVALLAALLTLGSISDHIGRRPAISAGFLILALGMVILWHADSAGMLIAARGVQGLASGILVSTLAATITDCAPPERAGRAALVNSAMPMVGLMAGLVVAGAALRLIPGTALTVVFGAFTLVYLGLAIAIWFAPEPVSRTKGVARSLLPRAVVPTSAKRMFGISVPVLLASWATGGLFFSLGPGILIQRFAVSHSLLQSLVLATLPGAGAVAIAVFHGRAARTTTLYGATALATGTALMVLALVAHSLGLYVAAVAVTGTGFGTSFMGVVGSLAALVPAHQRAELFAALYTVSYLSFGVPTVIAGGLVTVIPLGRTAVVYGLFVALFAGAAALLRMREDV